MTNRVRQLVREVHGGNLHEAARHARMPYATLRELHRGDTSSPGLGTVAALAEAYAVPVTWFLDTEEETRPVPGWVGILPPDPESGADPRYARRVVIPFGAWSLVSVATRLDRWIGQQPAASGRPIVGGVTDPFEIRRRLTGFLLQPLLSARASGAAVPLPTEPPLKGEPPLTPERRERWLLLLRSLGEFWERTFAGRID